jgi:hypothetical protein
MRCFLIQIIPAVIILLTAFPCFSAEDNTGNHTLLLRGGVSIPLDDLDERTDIHLPYMAIAYRLKSPSMGFIFLEIEAGFFAYRSEREVAGERAILYTEPVMTSILLSFNLWHDLYILPGFGVGIILNQVTNSSSPGSYNHAGCAPGVEFMYRITDAISLHVRARALFGFDKNRIFYHIIPDAGVSYGF